MEELFGEIEAYLARGERLPMRMADYLFPSGVLSGYDPDPLVNICAWLLQYQDSPELRDACVECAAQTGVLRLANALNAGEGSTRVLVTTEGGPGVWHWGLESDAYDAAIEALARAARIFDELVDAEGA